MSPLESGEISAGRKQSRDLRRAHRLLAKAKRLSASEPTPGAAPGADTALATRLQRAMAFAALAHAYADRVVLEQELAEARATAGARESRGRSSTERAS